MSTFNPDHAGWAWSDLGITETEAQAIDPGVRIEDYDQAKAAAPLMRSLVASPGVTILRRVADELVRMGARVRFADGWATRGYLPLAPTGLINHWIVSTYRGTATEQTLGLIIRGHSTLAGPLANIYMDFDGGIVIVAALSANHGGAGAWRGVSGNSRWLGVECEGGPILQPAQLATLPKLNAAVGRALGKPPGDWSIGHHEYAPTRKIDIGSYMPPIRAEAQRLYAAPVASTPAPAPAPTPAPATNGGFLMALTDAQQDELLKRIQNLDERLTLGASLPNFPAGMPFGYLPALLNNQQAILAAVSKAGPVDPVALGQAIADAIRPTVAEALSQAGSGASADEIADKLAARLAS